MSTPAIFCVLFLLSQGIVAFARADAPSVCPKPTSAQDILRCIQVRNPEILHSKVEYERANAAIDQASQIPNPDFQLQSVYGKNDVGDQADELTAVLEQPIELGGRRSGRIGVAESQAEKAKVELSLNESKAVIEGILKLHRLRQLQAEKHTLSEAITSFEKLVQQFSVRPRLTPEQEVSQTVFRMAKSDYELRMTGVIEDELDVLKTLKVATGLSTEDIQRALPKEISEWPSLTPNVDLRSPSPTYQIKKAELQGFESALEQARGESWPEFRLGPMYKYAKDGTSRAQSFGFSLSMSLPFWNLNGGGRAAANKGVAMGEIAVATQAKQDEIEYERLFSLYGENKKALKLSPSPKDLARKHESLERQFLKGLVTSSLVIEAHRSLADLQKNRNEREIKTLETLWDIYLLQGRVLTELSHAEELKP